MRLFVALLPPPSSLDALASAIATLRALPGADRLRWTEPASWHLTLAFYGEVTDDLRPGLAAKLAAIARRHPPFPLRLAAGGRFGDRALWADVFGDREPLVRLAGAVREAGHQAGAEWREEREYQPHLTLARHPKLTRNREPTGAEGAVDLGPYVEALTALDDGGWEAREIALVRSRSPLTGVPGERPRYQTVAAWPLGG